MENENLEVDALFRSIILSNYLKYLKAQLLPEV